MESVFQDASLYCTYVVKIRSSEYLMMALRNIWLSASLNLLNGGWSEFILHFILLDSSPVIFGAAVEEWIQGSSKTR